MQKIDAANWISAARSCSPATSAVYPSAMAKPRNSFGDAHRPLSGSRN